MTTPPASTEIGTASGEDRTCLLILGMHRSGTSLLSRLVNLGGFDLPADLLGANDSNPTGHWEPQALIDLNDAFLRDIGSHWDDWAALALDRVEPERLARYRSDLRGWLRREFAARPRLALKEPRSCRLAPEVLGALAAEGVTTRVVLPFRNPLEVARSLERRDGIALRAGVLIWLRHVLDAERFTRHLPRSFTDYDGLMASWPTEMRRIAADLGQGWPVPIDAMAAEADRFVGDGVRHHASDTETLRVLDFTATLALPVYAALCRLCDDPLAADAMADLDRARATLDEMERLVHPLVEDGWKNAQELATLRADHARLLGGLKDMIANIAGLSDLKDSVSDALSELRARQAAADAALAASRELVGRRDQSILALQDENRRQAVALEELRRANAAAQAQRAETLARLRQAQAQADQSQADASARIADIKASTSWKVTAPMRATSDLLRGGLPPARRSAMAVLKRAWWRLPLSPRRKQVLKDSLFPRLRFVIGGSGVYQNWLLSKQTPVSLLPGTAARARDTDSDAILVDAPAVFVDRHLPIPLIDPKARLIAFYLPQFHPIPENDAWWGAGFTEWTNVRPAMPMFPGHHQPHEPVPELGHYDLGDPAVMGRQIELARLYGVGGFCFYWYWFGGKRLLEKPVERWLADPSLDFPFCLCWANENWSRRWDGLDSELLIAQDHSPQDDLAFIAALAPYLRDPRYIRIEGRPLVLVYRPSLLPDARATADRWRTWCRQNGLGEIHLAYTQSFDQIDPAAIGFDSAIEFPPNNHPAPQITEQVPGLAEDFGGIVYDARTYLRRSRDYPKPAYRLFRAVFPSWDNTARRKLNGSIFANTSPELYREWLENAVTQTRAEARGADDRIIFCNAWNEWAEGAHLEPDAVHGYGFLAATRAALNPRERPRDLLLVGHDAHPHGAQMLLLNLARIYAANGFGVTTLLLRGGELAVRYAEHGPVVVLDDPALAGVDTASVLRRLRHEDGQIAIVNTTVSGAVLPALRDCGFRTVTLVHEMTSVYRQMGLDSQMQAIADHGDTVVFPARIVRDQFQAHLGRDLPRSTIRPQGLYRHHALTEDAAARHRARLRAELGIPDGAPVLFGVGYVDQRKGADLFLRALADLRARGHDARGVWIGHVDQQWFPRIERLAGELGLAGAMNFPGRQDDPLPWYALADVFLLTSREDPYPSVVLEAMAARLPVVMFAGVTGAEDLADRGLARAVPFDDHAAMAGAVADLLDDPDAAASMADRARAALAEEGDFNAYALDLLALSGRAVPRVSVIVPNYNYARYIEDRLRSVLAQDHPIYELIVLDDASTDDSLARIRSLAAESARPMRIVPGAANSGNVFRQWRKGIEMARGEFIWIAEADDLATPDFLTTVMRGFEDPEVVLSYCDSAQIDEDGRPLAADYRYYTDPVSSTHWARDYLRSGAEEIASVLYLKNTIPNVSAVVMRADALRAVMADHQDALREVRFVGDWLVYLWLLERGGIAFSTRSCNIHRRHQNSVTLAHFGAAQLAEIRAVQRRVIAQHRLGGEQQARAEAYASELAAQFGLAETTAS